MPSGARIVVDSLKREGVKVIFGIPGLSNMPIYDAFLEDLKNGELRHVLMRHEQAAAHAADAYARVSGFPGVCTATSGPGVTNLVTGLISAYWDSSCSCNSRTSSKTVNWKDGFSRGGHYRYF